LGRAVVPFLVNAANFAQREEIRLGRGTVRKFVRYGGGWRGTKLFEDAGDYVVVVGLGDFGAVERARDQGFVGAEVIDENLAVDFGGLIEGAALPEEVSLFGFAFDEDIELAADPLLAGFAADFLLQAHELAAAGFDGALRDFFVEREGASPFFVGVAEDS
jgi:hypothetical protein